MVNAKYWVFTDRGDQARVYSEENLKQVIESYRANQFVKYVAVYRLMEEYEVDK